MRGAGNKEVAKIDLYGRHRWPDAGFSKLLSGSLSVLTASFFIGFRHHLQQLDESWHNSHMLIHFGVVIPLSHSEVCHAASPWSEKKPATPTNTTPSQVYPLEPRIALDHKALAKIGSDGFRYFGPMDIRRPRAPSKKRPEGSGILWRPILVDS